MLRPVALFRVKPWHNATSTEFFSTEDDFYRETRSFRKTMLTKRIIPCLDVRAGKVTKGIEFKGNVDIGDPVQMGKKYYIEGADELVFYDITASSDKRNIMIDVVSRVGEVIFIPYSVGGGIRTFEDMRKTLLAGAEKVSVNSAAVRRPEVLTEGAKAFGNQCVVLSMDVKNVGKTEAIPSGFEIVIDGGRTHIGLDAIDWCRRGVDLGAGEIVVNSIDQDGKTNGYQIELTRAVAEAVPVPVIASGGAGKPEHLREVFTDGKADAAIIASMIHYGDYTIPQIKDDLKKHGIAVRTVPEVA